APQARTDALAAEPRAKDQTQHTTLPSAHQKAPPPSPPIPTAQPRTKRPAKPPAAVLPAARGRSCAGSRAAQQRPPPLPPAPHGPPPPAAEPPAGSCTANSLPPDAPKTTADAAHTTAGSRLAAQQGAMPDVPPALPPNP